MNTQMYNISEASQKLKISQRTIRRYHDLGLLGVKIGRQIRISEDQIAIVCRDGLPVINFKPSRERTRVATERKRLWEK